MLDIVCCHNNSSMWLDLGKCHLDGFTLWHKKLFWPQRPSSGCQEPGDHCTMYTQADITRIFSNLMSACLPRLSQSALGNIVWCELVSVERVNGGRGQRDAFTSASPRLTRERGGGGNINWYSSKSGIAFFPYTRCIRSPQQQGPVGKI